MDDVFGRYRLYGLLGAGGMGHVYRAFDTELHREVAIKVLPPQAAVDPAFEARFRREALAAAGLGEPHVVPIFDSGEIDGRLFIAMQLINGSDVATLLTRHGPMPPEHAVVLIEQAAAALDAAHAAGLVHRDVKPANLLVTPRNFLYLIDFGIANAPGETKLTNTGAAIGTVAYMAPERFTTGQCDKRADIYALTCVLHECLTGSVPYPATSVEQQMFAHVNGPPPRLSRVHLNIPTAFDDVIAYGMARDPDRRYQRAGDLAVAARNALQGTPTPPQPATASTVTTPHLDDRYRIAGALAPTQLAIASPSPPRARSRRRIITTITVAAIVIMATATGLTFWGKARDGNTSPFANSSTTPSPTITAPYSVAGTIKVGMSPSGIAVDPTSHTAYVADLNTMDIIDTMSNRVIGSLDVEGAPTHVAVDPATHRAYVTYLNGNAVPIIDTTTNTITTTIGVGKQPRGVAVDPTSHTAYITDSEGRSVAVIDTTTNTITANIPVGSIPMGIALDPGTHTAYIADSSSVPVIDTTTNTVITTIKGDLEPNGVAVDPATHTAYVTSIGSRNTVSVIDTATNTITKTFKVGKNPSEIAVDSSAHIAYVVNSGDATVSVIDTSANTVKATIKVGKWLQGIAVDPTSHSAYVTDNNAASGTVWVITPAR